MIDSVWEEDFTHQITDDGSGIGSPCTFVDLAGKPNFKFLVSLPALTALPSVGIDTGITIEGDEIQLHRTAGWMNVGGTNYTVTPIRCDVDALRVHLLGPCGCVSLCLCCARVCAHTCTLDAVHLLTPYAAPWSALPAAPTVRLAVCTRPGGNCILFTPLRQALASASITSIPKIVRTLCGD